ncbi:MAG: biopolymer transporter ExbD [Desulfuromonadales bacterium]|nr:biopolymer transporter ExbD [Desulfuromonadales bacterium]MDW7757747.1 biopolymer transporter ExbD [Desulfuromonadales bacterium]
MARRNKKTPGLNLTSLMDVFTILVFFLLFNSGAGEVLEAPKTIKLPDSSVESKPRETVIIIVAPDTVLVQGEEVASTPEVLASSSDMIGGVAERLNQLERNIIGDATRAAVDNKEVTILADKAIPFVVLKKIMTTCTGAGYGKISLAVNQKPSES